MAKCRFRAFLRFICSLVFKVIGRVFKKFPDFIKLVPVFYKLFVPFFHMENAFFIDALESMSAEKVALRLD